MKRMILCIALILCTADLAHAAVIDQQNTAPYFLPGTLVSSVTWQQQITTGLSGYLEGIEIFVRDVSPQNITAKVQYLGSILGEDTKPWNGTTSPIYFDFSSYNIFFNPGNQWLFLVTGSLSDWGNSYGLEVSLMGYAGGLLYDDTTVYDYFDLRFIEYIRPLNAVPEPASLLLLTISLGGLAGLRRKFTR